MLKVKRKNMMIIVFITVICALVLSMFADDIRYTAKAETAEEIAKQMTESDKWYDDNMVEHDIQGFAEELLQSSGAANRDIFKIIPIEYLRTTNEEKAYSYMGKEYGFYVRHRKVIPASITGQTLDPVYVLDILLIDFYYEDLHNQASFKIQVIPLFSETFFYNNNDGEESLSRITHAFNLGSVHGSPDLYQDYRKKLAIANPRFGTFLLNENDLNYGDTGYNKQNDDGLVITQSRINYQGSKIITNIDGTALAEYAVDKLLGLTFSLAGAGVFYDFISEVDSLTSALGETFTREKVTVTCDNEKNIVQYQTKESQKESSDPSYIRSIWISPSDELVFEANNGYAENVVVLNDSTSSTRISRIGMFDIVDLSINNEQYVNEVDEYGARIPFVFGRQDIVYQEEETLVMESGYTESDTYLLYGGEQRFSFVPKFAGNYHINAGAGCTIQVFKNDTELASANNSLNVDLKNDERYSIRISSGQAVQGALSIALSPVEIGVGEHTVDFDNQDKYMLKLSVKNCYYEISCTEAGKFLNLYDENFDLLMSADNVLYAQNNGTDNYIEIDFQTSVSKSITLTVKEIRNVKYNDNGEVIKIEQIVNGVYDDLLALEKTGYDFSGWWSNSNFSGEKVTIESLLNFQQPDINLYAKWVQIEYNITYTENGGTEIADESYTIEDYVVLNNTITRNDYVFLGWYDNPDFEGESITEFLQGTIGNKVLYARWVLEYYDLEDFTVNPQDIDYQYFDITFPVEGSNSVTVRYGENFVLPVAESEGFIFEGWRYNGQLITNENGESLSPYLYEDVISVEASWSREQIKFKLIMADGQVGWLFNDGISDVEQVLEYQAGLCPNCLIEALTNESDPNLDEDIYNRVKDFLYREGYIYKHLTVDLEGTTIACHNTISIFTQINENNEIVLYPQYEKEKYTITFVYDKIESGVIETETEVKTIFYGDNINYPEIDNVAMNFISWQTDDGAEFNYMIMPDISENAEGQEGDISIKLTLNYNLIRFAIDYVIPESIGEITVLASRYDLDESRPLSYNVTESIVLPEIESEYYEFIGWYTDENYANRIETVEKGSTGNLTLYAKLELVKYTIEFYDDKKINFSNVPSELSDGESFTLPQWVKENYNGIWECTIGSVVYGDSAFNSLFTLNVPDGVTKNDKIVFKTKWSGKLYNISYENLDFQGQTAMVLCNTDLAPTTHQYGVELSLSNIEAVYFNDSPYSSQLIFIGWCLDKELNKPISTIRADCNNNVILYAKWRYDFAHGASIGEHTVTDVNPYQPDFYDDVYLGLKYENLYNELDTLGIKKVYIEIKIKIREINDGYQEILLYKGTEASSELLASSTEIEHGPGELDTSTRCYRFTIWFDLEELGAINSIYVRYGAHGTGKDNWVLEEFEYNAIYVTSESDINASEFSFEDLQGIPDESCNSKFPLVKN